MRRLLLFALATLVVAVLPATPARGNPAPPADRPAARPDPPLCATTPRQMYGQ